MEQRQSRGNRDKVKKISVRECLENYKKFEKEMKEFEEKKQEFVENIMGTSKKKKER